MTRSGSVSRRTLALAGVAIALAGAQALFGQVATGSRVATVKGGAAGGGSGSVATFTSSRGGSSGRVATVTGDRRFASRATPSRTRVVATRGGRTNTSIRRARDQGDAPIVRVRRAGATEQGPGLIGGVPVYQTWTAAPVTLAMLDTTETTLIALDDSPLLEYQLVDASAGEQGASDAAALQRVVADVDVPDSGAPVSAEVIQQNVPPIMPIIAGGTLGDPRRR